MASLLLALLSNAGCAALEPFYGTLGYRVYQHDEDEAAAALSEELGGEWEASDFELPDHAWNFGLGYRFTPLRVFTHLESTSASFLGDEIDYFNWGLGAGYEYQLPKGFYVALDAEYSVNGSDDGSYHYSPFDSTADTFGLVFTVGYSHTIEEFGPVGANYQVATRDPYGLETARISHQISAEYPGVIAAFVFAAAGAAGAVPQGGGGGYGGDYSYAWDQLQNEYGSVVWRCRGMQTGRFAEDWRCAGKYQVDSTWPGW